MTRKYELRRRAEQVDDTRRRIVEAAIDLHQTIGPARTSVSAVAELAGVQRQTYYRHFPDERSLVAACTGLYMERAPAPDPESLRAIGDASERLERALTELYGWYADNERMFANVIRDAAISPTVREAVEMGLGSAMTAMRKVLAEALPSGDPARTMAVLDLVLDFNTWRTLIRRSGLEPETAVKLMASVVRCAAIP